MAYNEITNSGNGEKFELVHGNSKLSTGQKAGVAVTGILAIAAIVLKFFSGNK